MNVMNQTKITIKGSDISLGLIFRDGTDAAISQKRTIIALGTFDGVHIAHRELLRSAQELKARTDADLVGVWCFAESPAAIIHSVKPTSLTSLDERLSLLIENGADFVVIGRFEELRDTSATDFVNEILISKLGCVGTACGYDHCFGAGGKGNGALLENIFGKENTVILPEIKLGGETVSSSNIRRHALQGEIESANAMLSRPLSFTAKVTEGKKLGRRIGVPTANQIIPPLFTPLKHGVYATKCSFDDGKCYVGVSNVGIRPSIRTGDDHTVNCETYIVDFSGEIYGREMKVEFFSFLREEKKFSSLEELSSAISLDCERAISFFK